MQKHLVVRVLAGLSLLCLPLAGGAQTPAAVFDGKPEFKEGKALGYFIWRDGDTWKLRWMTFGAAHKFAGRVVVEGGEIESFKRIDPDKERQLIRPGKPGAVVRGPRGRAVGVRPGRAPVVAEKNEDRIEQESETIVRWLTNTNDDLDGVDIKVTRSTRLLRFNLLIDGEARPQEVEIGRNNVKASESPVRALLRP
jgi:hypothetical protein